MPHHHVSDDEGKAWVRERGLDSTNLQRKLFRGWTAFLLAARSGNLAVCKWLARQGAADDARVRDVNGSSPLIEAARNGHVEVCTWLIEETCARETITTADNDGCTPFYWACVSGCLRTVRLLYAAGAAQDVRRADKHGATPMLEACRKGNLDICQWLAAHGAAADLTVTNVYGRSPLLRAAWNGQLEVVRWLLQAGAGSDLSKADHMGITPLFYAAVNGRLDCARLLYSAGAREDVRALDLQQNTPLTLTMTHGSALLGCSLDDKTMEVVQWLLLAGAEVRLCDVERECSAGNGNGVWDEVIAWAQKQLLLQKTFRRVTLFGMRRKSGSKHLSKLESLQSARPAR